MQKTLAKIIAVLWVLSGIYVMYGLGVFILTFAWKPFITGLVISGILTVLALGLPFF